MTICSDPMSLGPGVVVRFLIMSLLINYIFLCCCAIDQKRKKKFTLKLIEKNIYILIKNDNNNHNRLMIKSLSKICTILSKNFVIFLMIAGILRDRFLNPFK